VRRLIRILIFTVLMPASGAAAQSLNPGPPGPFVFDFRAAMSGVPVSPSFVPSTDTDPEVTAVIPSRGWGGSIGVHLYPFQLGPARVGVGADALYVRGTTPDVTTALSAIDPQISANFGTADGWSYLSVGYGVTRVNVDPVGVSESMPTFTWGGGARWFLGPHFGVGFDVRVHQISAGEVVPKDTAVSFTVGVSLK
jgi:Outer membrane protein beta-barrel domain